MDFELPWLLLGLPVAFALGWIASRLDLRQLKRENRDNPRAYFKGLNLLLNEQQDKAVDAFVEAVQNDPDTAELHFALGNLFRRRGEFERAVRAHEHLIARADLKPEERARAQHALAQDFMRAGLFDRAEDAYRKLEGTTYDDDARQALLSLHERSRDWDAATTIATQLEAAGGGSYATRIAHYQCERALEAEARGDAQQATAALEHARSAAPQAARPLVQRGQMQMRRADAGGALQAWDELREVRPEAFGLVAADYARLAAQAGRADDARQVIEAQYAQAPSMALLHALLPLQPNGHATRSEAVLTHLRQAPSLSAAQALLAEPPSTWGEDGLAAMRTAVARAAKPLQRYRCAACGFEAQHYFWQCPGCLSWDSFPPQPVEEL